MGPGHAEDIRRSIRLANRLGQHRVVTMSGLPAAWSWAVPVVSTLDGLPWIGPHRNYPRHLFALGGSADSLTGAFVAARILLRALQGGPDKGDEVFGWTR